MHAPQRDDRSTGPWAGRSSSPPHSFPAPNRPPRNRSRRYPSATTAPSPPGPRRSTSSSRRSSPPRPVRARRSAPAEVAVEATLPPTALARFAGLDAATLSAVARLTVRNTVGDTSADASWQDLTAPPADLPTPGEGDSQDPGALTLTATGDVPTVAFGSPGATTLAPDALALALTSLTESGEPTTPPGLDVACTPRPPARSRNWPPSRSAATRTPPPPHPGPARAIPHRIRPPPARPRGCRPPHARRSTPSARSGAKPWRTTRAAARSRSRPSG